ncbi:alpha/beta fold hydrolase [Jannaschia formosa]|uniref:alpha/beta fold hydrolase n=1 Tax=Jannaschia formosa TaxID=2259592 RepID=UPI000E1B8AC4|nr:alpha/beta fold hydrolase [Jannaschia formosa]TFL18067.1 alpha/beta fold hydrolase [Jannaschia formosa]
MRLLAVFALAVALLATTFLERERAGLSVTRTSVDGTPVTLWREAGDAPLPLVVVAHGYAGSRQMMRANAITLARTGLEVAVLDLPGHGRHPRPMTGDVTRLDGATAMLTREVIAVTRALLAGREAEGLALLGHSMATDIVVRAAEALDPEAVVAISMYSEAVTPAHPARLLILSGAQERRLREVAVEALQQVDPDAQEGETAKAPGVVRRAAAAPWVGHVGVLYAPSALREARDWIAGALGTGARGAPPATALWLMLLLGSLVALARPLAAPFGPPRPAPPSCPRRLALVALLAPVAPAIAAAAVIPDLGGLRAFAPLAAFLTVWGGVQGAVLWRAGRRLPAPSGAAATVLAVWAFGAFALALDRYGASFLPWGPRLPVAAMLLPGALLFVWADALLTQGAGLLLRLVARGLPLLALLGAMFLDPILGVAFTVLPVTVLFWLVFGTVAQWMARNTGAGTPVPVLGAMLAWALAASTPLIAP